MRSVKEGKDDQVVSQSRHAGTCNRVQEREWIFKKLKVINSKIMPLAWDYLQLAHQDNDDDAGCESGVWASQRL
jgi:hypothetical protein